MRTETTESVMTPTPLPLKDLQAIVASLRAGNPEPTPNEIWNDAAITGAFSLSAGGGNLDGWISLYDGRVYRYQILEIKERWGTAAGTFALPYVRVRPLKDQDTAEFDLQGFLTFGSLKLDCVKDPLPVISASPWDYRLIGTVKLTKA